MRQNNRSAPTGGRGVSLMAGGIVTLGKVLTPCILADRGFGGPERQDDNLYGSDPFAARITARSGAG